MANFFMRRTPGAYPSQPAPPSPLTRGKAWQMPPRPAGLKSEAAPPSIMICRLSSIVGMVATVMIVPAEQFSAHLTSVASIAAKMASPIKSLLTSTASIAAKAVSPIKDLLTSTASIAATMKDPNAGSTGNDSFTTVLLHMDGANNSTSIVDSNAGGSAHTWTCAVNAQQKTAAQKFGTASALICATEDFSRSGIQAPDHADWHFGSGDFTIDFWFKNLVNNGNAETFFWWGGGARKLAALMNDTTFRKITSYVKVNGTGYSWEGSISISDTNWHHYALVRTGNTLKMFIDGVNDGANQTVSGAVDTAALDFMIGNATDNSSVASTQAWVGYIDEFRISKGIARWTSNFTPPVAPYS